VETRNLRDLVHFSDDGPTRSDLFESERLWAEVICLEPNQAMGPMADPDSDAVFVIVAGEAVVQVDRSRKRLKQWESALAPAGGEVTLTSASPDPTVVLVVAAPPPTPRAVNG
jgi:mannose-6-phosphate isomerase-like protein (cupin superfamily)